MSLIDKLLSSSTIKVSSVINESKLFDTSDMIQTPVPMINVGLSGRVDGGLTAGHLMIAGPSKHFKSAFSLLMASSFQAKHKDGVVLFYDSEFGTPQSYFDSFAVDTSRVIHTPVTDIEELKFDIANQLHGLTDKDKVCIVIDSIGNIASRKEVEDAKDQKSVADMTRAKQLKSMFRIVTPHLRLKNIPLVTVNHTYKEIGMYPKDIVSGGTGGYYSADTIWIVGRQKRKDESGYNFVINIEKSRFVRERSRIPITVTWDGGIAKWSGLLDVAMKFGYAHKPKNGWYETLNPETGEVLTETKKREDDMLKDSAVWEKVFKETKFLEDIKKHYSIGGSPIINDAEAFVAEGEEAIKVEENLDD